jgi:hypothetical protein
MSLAQFCIVVLQDLVGQDLSRNKIIIFFIRRLAVVAMRKVAMA